MPYKKSGRLRCYISNQFHPQVKIPGQQLGLGVASACLVQIARKNSETIGTVGKLLVMSIFS